MRRITCTDALFQLSALIGTLVLGEKNQSISAVWEGCFEIYIPPPHNIANMMRFQYPLS